MQYQEMVLDTQAKHAVTTKSSPWSISYYSLWKVAKTSQGITAVFPT